VLVSELMLQQTPVARVTPRYGEFLGRFPTLESVARARLRTVVGAWDGLGYYARARSLHKLARTVVHETARARYGSAGCAASVRTATLPAEPRALEELPGIGPYTAAAVACFAFEVAAPLVDTNVARVLTRVFAPGVDPRTAAGRRAAWTIARATLPRRGAAAYTHNQALMELGALVCTARVRHCGHCPVRGCCRGREEKKERRK
jgi:A/G-specific adenine glycosylase